MNIDDAEERAALQQEIQTAIAAGREVGPDMDKHLADSVLDRYAKDRAIRQRAQTVAPARATPPVAHTATTAIEAFGRSAVGIAAVAAFAVVLIFRPESFWVIFPLMFFIGPWIFRGRGGWSGRHGHHGSRNYYRRNDDIMSDDTPRSRSEYI